MRHNQPLTNVQDALDYIGRVVFYPEYEFKAWNMGGDIIDISVCKTMKDSSDAPDYKTDLYDTFDIDRAITLSDIPTEDHLGFVLLDIVRQLRNDSWDHEVREFFRIRQDDGTYPAPFHPHHYGYSDHGGNHGTDRWTDAQHPVGPYYVS